MRKITVDAQKRDDVFPGFKQRIHEIVYGEEEIEEVKMQTGKKSREKNRDTKMTPSDFPTQQDWQENYESYD